MPTPQTTVTVLAFVPIALGAVRSLLRPPTGTPSQVAFATTSLLVAAFSYTLISRSYSARLTPRPVALAPLPDCKEAEPTSCTNLPSAAAGKEEDTLPLEVGLAIIGFGAALLCAHDVWTLVRTYRKFGRLSVPNCYVVDKGIITSETCEAFYARVGEENLTQPER